MTNIGPPRPIINQVVAEWAATEPNISKVWLYGSFARNDATAESDIDLAVALRFAGTKGTLLWIDHRRVWSELLTQRLGREVHLELAEPHQRYVWPAVLKEGQLLFGNPS